MKAKVTCTGLIVILVLFLFSVAEPQTKKLDLDNPIKIGYIFPLHLPKTDQPGLELAVEEINAAGGVLGRPLKLIVRDSKLNPEQALREVKDLVIKEKVFWVQGAVSSSEARAISEFCKTEKMIYVIEQAKSDKLLGEWGHRYVFSATNNAYMEAVGIAAASKQIFGPYKKIYNLSPDYEGGRAAWRNFFESYKKLVPDAKVVGEVWPKLGTQDYTSYLTAVMNSDAELMFTAFYQTDALTMIKQSISIGLNGKIAVVGLWWGENLVPLFDASFYPKKTIGGGVYAFWGIDKPESKEFVKKIKSRWDVYPTYAVSGYSFVKTMAKAIQKVGSLNTEKVIDALEGATMESPIGPVEIRACDHQAMWPSFVGLFGELPGWPFYGPKDAVVVGREAYLSCEEIAKLRKK